MIQPVESDPPDKTSAMVVFVAASSPRLGDPSRIVATLRRRYPQAGTPRSVDTREGTILLQLEDQRVLISPIPAPIPWGDLEGPCETAWWWPEAARHLRRHTHHFIVALMGPGGGPVERHLLLSQVVCAVLEHSDALGVYWAEGTLVHEPSAFVQEANELTRDDLRSQLWIDLRLIPNEDGTMQLFSTGLTAWGSLEVECERCPWSAQELYAFARGLVDYLIRRGESIGDEETVGRNADEKITIRHRPSLWDRGTVMRLEFE